MDIAVDDRSAGNRAVPQESGGGNRHIVEDAVTLPAIAEGVVRASGEIRRDALV